MLGIFYLLPHLVVAKLLQEYLLLSLLNREETDEETEAQIGEGLSGEGSW